MAELQSFGYWLRLKRKAHDLTREALAERVGCSTATIRKLEAEERRPSEQIALLLADVFDVSQPERSAFVQFARHGQAFSPASQAESQPWKAPILSASFKVPSPITCLVGRKQEIADLRRYLSNSDIRLITLVGPPGIGKSRLSIELAHLARGEFLAGIYFIELAPLVDPSQVAQALASALGYVEARYLPVNQQLAQGIGEQSLLLILDNAEHVIEMAASLTYELLSACPQLKFVVTSREPLNVPGEWLFTVPLLEIPAAKTTISLEDTHHYSSLILFAERALAVRPEFTLNQDNLQAVASICTQLDGLPLAIELIAARIRWMTPKMLLDSVFDTAILNADGRRAVPLRQKSLNQAIAWSYNLLSPLERTSFAWLAIFSSGFSLKAAEAVLAHLEPPVNPGYLIASLADKSLLRRAYAERDEVRFEMLSTIQRYASLKLNEINQEVEAHAAHLQYYLELAEGGEQYIHGPQQIEWLDRLDRERDNFRSALDWGINHHKTESVLRLLNALGWPWEVRGYYSEARYWLEKIRGLPNLHNHNLIYTRLLNHIGRHSWTQENIPDARALLLESLSITEKAGVAGELVKAETLNWMSLLTNYHDNNSQLAVTLVKRGLDLYKKWEDQRGIALSTFHLGIFEGDLDHDDLALTYLEQSLELFQQFGDLFFISRVSIYLGYLYLKHADYDKALFYMEKHLAIDIQLNFWDGIADGWRNIGYLYRQRGNIELSDQCYEKSRAVCREHGLNKFIS